MGAIDKLQQRPTFGSALVQQAMQEARTDPKAQAQLQQLVDQRPADFEDAAQVDHCHQLLAELSKDTFQIVPNRQTGALGKPEVLEARITKVKDEARRVDITPPPPAPPVYRQDPLNVTGHAPAGSKVELYNASIPGRPALGSVVADANGAFNYELTDETKFKFGDQIGVRLSGRDGQQGRPLIVPTEPFLITNTVTTYFTRSGGVENDVRTDYASAQVALDKKTDERPPFFQQSLVKPKLDVPSVVEQPYLFTIIGGDDAVEPNASLKVTVGNDVFQTKSDDMGQFALKVSGVIPGQRLSIEVRDLNGNGIDIPARVPPIALPQQQLIAGMSSSSEGLRVNALGLVPPGGALIARNASTGVVSELAADKNGKLDGVVKGINTFDAFEVAVRDVNGHVSEQAALLVAVPQMKVGTVIAASSLNTREPDLVSALQNLSGPPVDLVVNGQKKPGGPFLPLPTLPQLPVHAILEVIKDGAVVQSLRADVGGKLNDAMLRGVHVGDALSFRLRDAAGRLFPTEIKGFVVPDGKCASKVSGHVPARLQPLDATAIGTGSLTVDPSWLAPARVVVGKMIPTDFQQRHAIVSQVGGALINTPPVDFMAQHFPEQKLVDGATLLVQQQAGKKLITIEVPGTVGRETFGYDDITGDLHNVSEQKLPALKQALSQALAIVGAAYAQGKEPGDVSYDRALGAAKTLMFVLDRFAVQNPASAQAAKQVALDVLGSKPFVFEITPRDVVGAGRTEAIEAPTSQSLTLLQTRTLAMGAIGRVDNLRGATRPAVDASALSSIASFDGATLKLDGKGVVAAGDQLVVKVGDKVHTFTAEKGGALSASLPVASGTVVEFAQRSADDKGLDQRGLNPITRAVVLQTPILGEGHVVGVDALVQRAPAAADVVAAVFGGAAVKGLPPGGSIALVSGGEVVARLAIDESGQLGKIKGLAVKDGDVVDVRVLDAAGRPFAPISQGVVVGPTALSTGKAKLDVDALSLRAVIDQVGSGSLAAPRFPPNGSYANRLPSEAYAELNPFYGPSSTLETQGDRYTTKAAFPPGLLPDLAKASGGRGSSMGNSVSLSAHRHDTGTISIGAGYYLDNQRPDFGFTFNENTGELGSRFRSGSAPASIVDELPRLTTTLQTSLAFVAVAQKVGSEPGDGFYDLAARAAKTTLFVFDQLTQKHPTFRTEILAAVRAAVPPSMPFDLPPVANAAGIAQTAPTDAVPDSKLTFWNAVHHDDVIGRARADRWSPPGGIDNALDGLTPQRPNAGVGFFGTRPTQPFFGGNRSLADVPATAPTTPLYMRARER